MNTPKTRQKSRLFLGLAVCYLVMLAFSLAPASLAASKTSSKKSTSSGDSTQVTGNGSVSGYAADSDLGFGTIVRLDSKNNQKVIPATQKSAQDMYGVVVDPHLLSVKLSDAKYAHEVYVATSGNYEVLVSTQNGAIKAGDYIELSSIDGVAMNANQNNDTVFGRALNSFDSKSDSLGNASLKDSSGHQLKQVSIGAIPVAINIQRNPNEKSTKLNAPSQLQKIGEQVADKPIAPVKLYVAVVVLLLTLVAAVVILYSGIRNSMISLGRNPLSKKTILRGLIEVVLTAIVILIIGVFAVYLLLKL